MKQTLASLIFLLGLSALATAQWSYTQHTQARWYHGSAVAGDQFIVAGGMLTGLAPSTSVEIYDLLSGTWSSHTLSEARAFMGVATHGTKAFFAGGGDFFGLVSDKIDVYDGSTGEWSVLQLSEARQAISAVTVGDKIIFAGGGLFDYPTYVPSDLVEIYDAVTGEWEYATLSEPRMGMASAVVGKKAIFAGGIKNSTEASAVVDIFDVEAGTWETATLSQARSDFAGAAAGSKAFFVGGFNPTNDNFDNVDIYDASTNTWTAEPFFHPVGLIAAASIGNRAYFAGGSTVDDEAFVDEIYNTFHIFDATEEAWHEELMQIKRVGASAAVSDNQVFISGGFNWNMGQLRLVEIYTDTAAVTTSLADFATPEEARLFPNPARESIALQWDGGLRPGPVTIRIFNALGQQMSRHDFQYWTPTAQLLDIRNLLPGTYSLTIEQKGKVMVGKGFVVR